MLSNIIFKESLMLFKLPLLLLLLLFFFQDVTIEVNGFVIHIDPNSHSWVTGMDIYYSDSNEENDDEEELVLVTGVNYYEDTKFEFTESGNVDTDCLLSFGNPKSQYSSQSYTFQSNKNLETPNLCTPSPIWLPSSIQLNDDTYEFSSEEDEDDLSGDITKRVAVLLGLNDGSSLLDTIQISTSTSNPYDAAKIQQVPSYPLLQNAIPVASISTAPRGGVATPSGTTESAAALANDDSGVIIAFQNMGGNTLFNSVTAHEGNNNNDLQNLLTFLEMTTMKSFYNSANNNDNANNVDKDGTEFDNNSGIDDPLQIDAQILRMNAMTGIPTFHSGFTMDDNGQATINAMVIVEASSGSSSSNSTRYLAVVGSTNGVGNAVGRPSGIGDDAEPDWDGYIAYLDPMTGVLLENKPPLRVDSQPGKNDYVHDVCSLELSDNEKFLYIVGTTDGLMQNIHTGGAFVWKIDAIKGDVIWKKQIAGSTVEGLACAVSNLDDDEQNPILFVGGTTRIDLQTNDVSTKSMDTWVSAMSVDTSQTFWTKQIDTSAADQDQLRDDVLVQLSIGSNGDVYALWNSIDIEAGINDAYLIDLDQNTGENDLSSGAVQLIPGVPLGQTGDDDEGSSLDSKVIILAIICPIVVLLCVFGYQWYNSTRDDKVRGGLQQKTDTEPSQLQKQIDPEASTGVL